MEKTIAKFFFSRPRAAPKREQRARPEAQRFGDDGASLVVEQVHGYNFDEPAELLLVGLERIDVEYKRREARRYLVVDQPRNQVRESLHERALVGVLDQRLQHRGRMVFCKVVRVDAQLKP